LQKFAQKKEKPPPVYICSFTSIFCKKPGVKEKHPSGVHTNSSEERNIEIILDEFHPT
jgi:hypothetical protein